MMVSLRTTRSVPYRAQPVPRHDQTASLPDWVITRLDPAICPALACPGAQGARMASVPEWPACQISTPRPPVPPHLLLTQAAPMSDRRRPIAPDTCRRVWLHSST